MEGIGICLIAASALIWFGILLLPWRPWSAAPTLDASPASGDGNLENVTVLVPARNEEAVIQATLRALQVQGMGLKIVLVNDRSADRTAQLAREAAIANLILVSGEPLPPGWSGKLWALEQGRRHVATALTMLVDADIVLKPGLIGALLSEMERSGACLVSLIPAPRMAGFWEKLLMPAYVYFFKLLYPFRLSNSRFRSVAAASGGCILLQTRVLEEIGGFASLKDALIDDCSLARRIKSRGHKIWIGLTHSACSVRSCERLGDIWNMVARTAFTQLKYSPFLLMLCTAIMALGFWMPVAGLFHTDVIVRNLAAASVAAMLLSYVPTLRYHGRSAAWALTMPAIGTLYLAMAWTSAVRYWRGERARWKGRSYESVAG
jgi:hopene-associated glycosyltransferase HpnB